MDLMTAPAAIDLAPGFGDAVRDSQLVFRAVMDAMSRPGETRLVEVGLAPPSPLEPGMAAIALALLDFETGFWMPADAHDAAAWIRFHTGARIAARVDAAEFVFLPQGRPVPALESLMLGSDEEPHRAATLVLGVRGFEAGTRYALSGPGIRETRRFTVDGLDPVVVAQRADLAPLFPRGLDVILTAGRTLAALPRTTRLEA